MSQEIPVHPAAMLFPMMFGEDLGNLADDIAANGLMEPIVLYHGQILDGRNRLAACELASVEPRFVDVDGDVPSPTLYVLSKNLHRRHLTASQRAAIGAEAMPVLQQESKKRSMANLKNQGSNRNDFQVEPKGDTREIVAKELQVMVYARFNGVIDQPSLATKLAKYAGGPSALVGDARGLIEYTKNSLVRSIAQRVIDTYNKGRSVGKLDPL